jgi:hypothetical protein
MGDFCNEHSQRIASLEATAQGNEKRMDRIEQKLDSIITTVGDFKTATAKQIEGLTVKMMVVSAIGAMLCSGLINIFASGLPKLLAMVK